MGLAGVSIVETCRTISAFESPLRFVIANGGISWSMGFMAQRSSKVGCIAVVVILIAIGAGVALIFVSVLKMRESRSSMVSEMIHQTQLHATAESGEHSMVFTEANRPKMSVPAPGEPVTLNLFAAFMIDEYATELAKDSFRKVADKAEVSWKMRLTQITDRNGSLRGEFDVPWQISSGNHTSGSSFGVGVKFDEAGRDALLKLRRGDWVTVEGRLSFAGGQATIESAMVAGAALAEKP